MTSTLCIYHGRCLDGFGAAWVVRHALGEDVEFYPGRHQIAPPAVSNKRVILVDFSYKRPVLQEMARQAESILILDHHLSAQQELVDLPDNVTPHFDLEHSGAIITWRHFFPDQPPPRLLLHIEDQDLWRFNLAGTEEIHSALFSYPFDFPLWDRFIEDPNELQRLRSEGVALRRKHLRDVEELIAAGTRRLTIGGHDVPALNAPFLYASDAGDRLCRGESFAACYWDTTEGRRFSLRSSRQGGIDVSQIASHYGGGGHFHAAAFTLPFNHPLVNGE